MMGIDAANPAINGYNNINLEVVERVVTAVGIEPTTN
jgi:hypothetical protein